ncbi:nonribosomal siderophore peptide synthase [Cordyceps fumosorosea ARSEF 2679]|uniref:Nonribosomal siderophore peptide synthase n=1 Tax=Cordyceps fumosorosea (strain ARSEF 2679) TaxID=1081104 RepID=A0A168B640_CORFA|nr:nonribosomal siderophore peptide synthase [Cordyceps fumosorosea ARSEF 2679]OAA69673.1 nonribosomal siderophore peptide synthase [Cordyceps fumosorosea ARSEF 2679]
MDSAVVASGLSVLNPSPARVSGPALLHHLVRDACEDIALEHLCQGEITKLTYKSLHQASDALAAQIALSCDPAQGQLIVPVLLQQSPDLYITLLAILKAGAVGQQHEAIARQPVPESHAYVMYTSGSTGTPKGVLISHSAATQAVLAHDPHIPRFSRFFQFAAPTFDVSVFEIFFPLFRGETLVSASRKETLNDLPAVLRQMNVDACELTPTVAASLLRKRENSPQLKLLMTIGEMLNPLVVKEFGGTADRRSILWAMYGPTEATIHCTLQGDFQSESSTGNIGTPLETASCFVIKPATDEYDLSNFELLPIGQVGELAVGGHQLATGYLNDERKTNNAFIASPYGRVYRTGDKAKVNTDGTLECLGRISDGQVKLRGQRIELGEIEHAALRTSGCHGATARVIGAILVLFCAVDASVSENDIFESCEQWLPQFMRPGEVVLSEELPRLPSGKVNAKELQRQFEQSRTQNGGSDDFRNSTEPGLLHVLEEYFGSQLSLQTELARAGLDSLTAIGLSSSLRQAGYDTQAASLLKMKNMGHLISSITKIDAAAEDAEKARASVSCLGKLTEIQSQSEELELEMAHRKVQDIVPCSDLQIAMLSETIRSCEAYWNAVDLELSTTASAEDVCQSLGAVVQQNEILRTGFVQHESTILSVIFDVIHAESIGITEGTGLTTLDEANFNLLRPLQIRIRKVAADNLYNIQIRLHHAIFDGWSLDLFKSDLAKAIGNERLPLRAQFRDVLAFSMSSQREQYDDKARVFWADYLFGWNKPPFPRLLSRSVPRGKIQSTTYRHSLPGLPNHAYNGSAQVPFQAALALVWGGILGLQDVVIGSVTSGRTIPVKGVENIMGPCISSLPLRVNMERMTTVDDLVNSISSSNRHMMEHSTLSQLAVKKIANMYGAEHLYDILFVYQESPEQRKHTTSVVREIAHLDRLETKLVLEVQPIQGSVILQATFHDDYFPPDMVDKLLSQVAEIAAAIVENTHSSLVSIRSSKSDPSAYNTRLEKMDPNAQPDNLAAIVDEAAAHYGDRLAVSFATEISAGSSETTSITYRDLNHNANRIANFLLTQNVKAGDVIPIIMNKSIGLYTAILGILKAGCGYLPLLPSTPNARILEIFKQSKSRICLTDEDSWRDIPPSISVCIIIIDEESMEEYPFDNPPVNIDSSNAAYVIYTSGTTGTPKGVTLSHKNIASNVTYLGVEYPDAAKGPSKFLQACSQAFDVSVFEIFFAWHKGMCLCAAINDVLFTDIEEAIRTFGVTHLSLTPTIASLIDPANVPSVEFLVTAGEPMTNAVSERWNEFLWQGYGPSETTNICSVKKMSPDDYIEHLGLVFDNTSVVVLEPKGLSTLAIGWAGEFCFGGDQVATGYLNMPRLTAEKFITHPYYGRLYRSGDFGRMLPDGSLVILGRIDDQVKLRGQRIEAAEINGIVSRVSSATAAVTLVLKQKDSLRELLVTFYVQNKVAEEFCVLDAKADTQDQVFSELHTNLLSYMVPSYLIPVSRIPLTPSGKVDKRAINAVFAQLSNDYLETVAHNISKGDDEVWNDTELAIASLMASSLKVSCSDIGRWTPLAILGLDSLTAIQVCKSLTKKFKTPVSISSVLQNPTVAQLARKLHSSSETRNGVAGTGEYFDANFQQSVTAKLAKQSKEAVEILPCSPLQEAMVSRGKANYYNKSLLRLRVDPYKMRSYWQQMCDRHSILRTVFLSTNSSKYPIAQVSLAKWELPWHRFTVTQPSLEDAIRDHLALVPEPLDTNSPPLSLAVIRYGETGFLSFICHHALYDGVAMECIWREVEALARGEQLKPPISQVPFVNEMLKLPSTSETFWKHQFAHFQPSLMFRKPHGQSVQQVTHTITIERSLQKAQQQIKSLGISLLSLCQATMARVLAITSQKTDVCFGNVMNGRTIGIEGIERLVAPCFNTVPIRQDMPESLSNIELAKNLLTLNTSMLEHQFTPLRQVQKIAATESRTLFDTLLLVQQPLREMDVNVWTLEEDAGVMDLPLVCEVTPCPNLNTLVLDVHYDMSAVPFTLAAGIAELFKHVLSQILEYPHAVLDRKSIPETLLDQVRPQRPFFFEEEEEGHDKDDSDSAWTDEELAVRGVLAELSQTPANRVEKATSLFKLGLDSINAVQVAALLRQKDYSVSASDIIDCQNCLKIAKIILENGSQPKMKQTMFDFSAFDAEVRPALSIEGDGIQVFPCTSMQSAMLSAYVSSGGVHYLNEIILEMNKRINAELIVAKWTQLVADHSMLRTGFAPVRHADSAYAMLQYESIQSRDLLITGTGAFDSRSWKENATAGILAKLSQPPWRLAIATVDDVVTVHLIIHHALYDATSLQELLSNFGRLLNDQEAHPVQDVSAGLSMVLQRSTGEQENAAAFWRQVGEQATINRFPLLTPLRENTRDILVEEIASTLTSSDLHQMTKSLGISAQAAILASWTRLLAGYTGEEAVVFGVTFSGRTCEATLNTPIPCLATVPVVAQNVGSNKELLDQTMRSVSDIHKYQHLPLSRIQKEMGYPATPVFDTLIAYQKIESETGDCLWVQKQDDAAAEFPVSLEVEPTHDGGLCLRLTYFSDVLPANQAKMLLRQFDATMEDLLVNPDGHQHDLHKHQPDIFAISPPLEPTMKAPVEMLHQFVEIQAQANPNKIALEHVSGFRGKEPIREQWTFAQLDAIGNTVANMLSSHTEAGSIIAIHFDKCPQAYFAILGILKSGSAFVALDFNAPSARKEFILQDSNAPCLLTSEDSVINFEVPCPVIVIDDALLGDYPETPCEINGSLTPSSTCYCLYTSGTTGTPKGCEITHENTVQCMMAFQDLFRGHWADDSRWLQFAALHFDVSVLEQYWSWSVGITVVSAKKDLILDDLIGFINNADITHIDLTPSLARLTHPDTVPCLCRGVFITGGEQLKQEILDAWGSKAVIYNAYGPTEATIGVTTYQRVPQNGRPSNIGRQFKNVGSYVFHKDTEIPVLRGAIGELCVSGKLVGKGYLNRPDLTAEKFPTLDVFGERIYRTGDLVRILHDGCFEFLGRADDQVKLRGQRLELGEIDHVIRSVENIRDVTTLVTKHRFSGKDVLVSFIVVEDQAHDMPLAVLEDSTGVGADARTMCRNKLPGYMVPSYFLKLPLIPLSPNNKAEAKQLKKLFSELSQEALVKFGSATAKRNLAKDSPSYQKLISLLAQFCSLDASVIDDSTSIFDLGVDSITALSLSAFFVEQGLSTASPALILRNPFVLDLAVALSRNASPDTLAEVKRTRQKLQAFEHKNRARVCRELDALPSAIEYIYPCSPLQQGMLAKTALEDGEGAYFNVFKFYLRPDAVVETARAAFGTLFEQESILRTTFLHTPDGYVQVARRDIGLFWEERTLAEDENVDQVIKSLRASWISDNSERMHTPVKVTLVTGPDTRMIVLHIFHGLYDGTSFELMTNRLVDFYKNVEVEADRSFADTLLHGPLRNHDNAKQAWLRHLEGWSTSPQSLPREAKSAVPIAQMRVLSLPRLEKLRSTNNVTMQSLLIALWVSTLQKYSRGNVTTGVIVSGRSIALPGVDKTIGPLFNTLPFFANISSASTWRALLQRCQDFNGMVLDDPHVPLQQLQKWKANGKSLFDSLFSYQIEGQVRQKDDVPWVVEDGGLNPDFPLALEVTKRRDGTMRLLLVAKSGLADELALDKMLDEFEDMLTSMEEGAKIPVQVESSQLDAGKADQVNGISVDDKETWSPNAEALRQEIALLSSISAADVAPSTTWLELGLDSIDAVQLSARLKRHNMMITPSAIMKGRSMASLAKSIRLMENGHESNEVRGLRDIKSQLRHYVEATGLDMTEVDDILPTTPLQDAMVSGMVESDFSWYFNHEILQVAPGIDVSKLQAAWSRLFETTPILRTGFVELVDPKASAVYAQVVYKSSPLIISDVTITSVDELQTIQEQSKTSAIQSAAKKNLARVVRVSLGESIFFVLSISHALYDGWSLGLLHQDLRALYYDEPVSRPSPDQFLFKSCTSIASEAQGFWSNYLEGARPTIVPPAEPDSSSVVKVEADSSIKLGEIGQFCREQKISLQSLCQACWAVILARKTRSLDVIFGSILSGRDFEGAEDLLFPTMNTVAVRSILHGSISSFLRYMEDNLGELRSYQTFPLRTALKAAKVAAGKDLFNSLFLLQKTPGESASESLFQSLEGSSGVDYPVCVEAATRGDVLEWTVACQGQSKDGKFPQDLVSELDSALEFILRHADEDVVKFSDTGAQICGSQPITLADDDNESLQVGKNTSHEWNTTCLAIREVLSQVSNIPEDAIDASSTLYHLGLDSITAIKVSTLLKQRGIFLRPTALVRSTSIAHMAEQANTPPEPEISATEPSWQSWKAPKSVNVNGLLGDAGIGKEQVEEVLPALPMQVYMMSTWQNTGGQIFYPEFTYRLSGSHAVSKIYDAWARVVKKVPMLRTCLLATGQEDLPFIQVLLKPGLSSTGAQPFAHPEVDRALDSSETILRLRIHHALYDGVSLPAIMDTLVDHIKGILSSGASTSIDQWANLATSREGKDSADSRRAFWTKYLDGHKTFPDGTDMTGPRTSLFKEGACSNITALGDLAAKNGIGLQSLILAAYARSIIPRQKSSPDSVVLGIYLANRSDERIPDILPTLNLVPLRIAIHERDSLAESARRIHEDIRRIAADGQAAQVGLWEVARWTGVTVDRFVNFLTLPGAGSGKENGFAASGDTTTSLELLLSEGMEAHGDIYDASVAGNAVRHAYPDSVDVEFAVRNGRLDMGVFGPRGLVTDEEAHELVDDVVRRLNIVI